MPTVYRPLVNKSPQPVWNRCFADMIKREGLSLWPLSLPFYCFPACLLHGLPFANFFFCLLHRVIHPSHAWENLSGKMHMRLMRKAVTFGFFFAYSQTLLPFCWRELLFMWCWLIFPIYIGCWLLTVSIGVFTVQLTVLPPNPLSFPILHNQEKIL